MSVLIKGVTLDELKELRAYELINRFPIWVEQGRIVEVKTPHGDLISKDSIIKRALMFEKFTGSKLYTDMVHNLVGSETPVIEAEE